MNIFKAIRGDYNIHRNLLAKLVETSGYTNQRDDLFKSLKLELKVHEDAEERHCYKAVD